MAVGDNIDWSVAPRGISPYQCQASNQGLPDVFSSIFAIGMRPYSAEATARRDTSNARRASSPRRRTQALSSAHARLVSGAYSRSPEIPHDTDPSRVIKAPHVL